MRQELGNEENGKVIFGLFLSEIPEHWEVRSLSNTGYFRNGVNKPKEAFGHGYRFVTVNSVYVKDYIRQSTLNRVELSENEYQAYSLNKYDILLARSSVKAEGIAYPAIMGELEEPTVFAGFTIRLRIVDDSIYAPFLFQVLRSEGVRNLIISISNTVVQTNVSQPALKSLKVSIPPQSEQQAIANFLNKKTAQIDMMVEKLKATTTKLEEYRTAIITAAVTGKIRVSEEV